MLLVFSDVSQSLDLVLLQDYSPSLLKLCTSLQKGFEKRVRLKHESIKALVLLLDIALRWILSLDELG